MVRGQRVTGTEPCRPRSSPPQFSPRRRAPPAKAARRPATAVTERRAACLIGAVAQSHDRDAFLALFNHFAPRLKGYMKKLGTPEPLAEELAQDVMFTVWRKAATYDPAKSAVSSWISPRP